MFCQIFHLAQQGISWLLITANSRNLYSFAEYCILRRSTSEFYKGEKISAPALLPPSFRDGNERVCATTFSDAYLNLNVLMRSGFRAGGRSRGKETGGNRSPLSSFAETRCRARWNTNRPSKERLPSFILDFDLGFLLLWLGCVYSES